MNILYNRKVNYIFFISVLLLILFAAFSYLNIRQFVRNERRDEVTNRASMRLENILSGLKDAQIAQRAYLLTGDSTFLRSYQRVHQHIMQNYTQMNSLVRGNRDQQLRLDTLRTLIERSLILAHNDIVLKMTNQQQSAQYPSSLVLEEQNLLNNIEGLIRRIQEKEKRQLSFLNQESFKAFRHTPLLGLILFFVLAMIINILSFFYTSKNLNSLKNTGEELKKSNNALRDTKQKLQGVLNSAVSGIVVFKAIRDQKDKIIDFEMVLANPAAEYLTGHDLQNNTNKRMLDIFPESKSSKRFEQYARVVQTGEPLNREYYAPYYGKWFLFSVVKLEDGLALTFSDISDKKTAEVQLKETRHFLEQITDATPDIVSVLNVEEGKVTYINKEISNALGYAVAEIYAMDQEDRERLIHPADRNKRREYFERFMALEDNKVEETEFRAKDVIGKWRTFCMKFKVFKRNAEHVPIELIGIAQDITDKKEKETAIDRKNEELLYAYDELKKVKEYLLIANQELERRVEERTKTLSDKNQELLKIKESLDTIVYMAAHDLRSPVSSLNLLVSLFEKSQDALKKENIMDAIKSSARRLDQTIKGLVEVIEVQHMQGDMAKSLDFSSMIAPILKENNKHLTDKKGEVYIDFSKGKKIKYVEAYLTSIFKNLITNAIKYASEKRDLVIKINTYEEEDFVVLTVEDNGIGMDLNRYGKNLFKPFKRFTEKAEGKGIGLHLIKNMIEKNGGRITVESEINKGTIFTCNLKKYL